MSRELNSALFGQNPSLPEADQLNQQAPMMSSGRKMASNVEDSQSKMVVNELVQEVRALKRKIHELENRSKVTDNRLSSLAQASKSQMERSNGACLRLDKALKTSVQELTTKYSLVSGKLTEQRVSDTKVQSMVDRHNTVVQSFETRVVQLQKLISEQEMKILNYHSALEEIRREFSRLKKS